MNMDTVYVGRSEFHLSPVVHLFLRRSQDVPIHLSIRVREGTDVPDILGSPELKRSVHRWEYLHIRTFEIDPSLLTLASFPPAPTLQSIHLEETFEDDEAYFISEVFDMQYLFSSETPMIKSVTASGGIVLPWTTSSLFVGLSHLDLSFMYNNREKWQPTFEEMLAILRACKNLESLSIGTWYPDLPRQSVLPVYLLRIKKANFGSMSPDCAFELFRNIHLPNLKHLLVDLDPFENSSIFDVNAYNEAIEIIMDWNRSDDASRRKSSVMSHLHTLELRSLLCSLQTAQRLLLSCTGLKKLVVVPSIRSQDFLMEAISWPAPGFQSFVGSKFYPRAILKQDNAGRFGVIFLGKGRAKSFI